MAKKSNVKAPKATTGRSKPMTPKAGATVKKRRFGCGGKMK